MWINILSDSWTGFTKFTLLKEKLPQGYRWSGVRLTKIQATTRPDYLWPEICIGMSKATQKKEKQEWAIEETKVANARKLRGIYFIDLEDAEYEEAIKNSRRKLDFPMEAAMPCKMEIRKRARKPQDIVAREITESNRKTKYAYRANPRESVWNPLFLEVLRITSVKKGSIQ